MANDVKIQNGKGVDENIKPLTVGNIISSLELSKQDSGAKVTGSLEVTDSIDVENIDLKGDITLHSTPNTGVSNYITSTSPLYIRVDDDPFVVQMLDKGQYASGVRKNILQLNFNPKSVNDDSEYTRLYIKTDSDANSFQIRIDGNGESTISNSSNTSPKGDIVVDSVGGVVLDAAGRITLDSALGQFKAMKAGTEFSSTSSSYAGMILGYSMIRNDQGYTGDNTTDAIITLDQTSFTLIESVQGTKAGVTFIAPPSGKVEIEFWAMCKTTNDAVYFGLSTSDSSYTEVEDLHTYNNAVIYFDESDYHPITIRWVVEGLSGSNTFYIWYKKVGGTAYLYHGEQFHHVATYHYPPITTKVTALPATFSLTGD